MASRSNCKACCCCLSWTAAVSGRLGVTATARARRALGRAPGRDSAEACQWRTDSDSDCQVGRETDGGLGLSDSASGTEARRRRSQADRDTVASLRLSRHDQAGDLKFPPTRSRECVSWATRRSLKKSRNTMVARMPRITEWASLGLPVSRMGQPEPRPECRRRPGQARGFHFQLRLRLA